MVKRHIPVLRRQREVRTPLPPWSLARVDSCSLEWRVFVSRRPRAQSAYIRVVELQEHLDLVLGHVAELLLPLVEALHSEHFPGLFLRREPDDAEGALADRLADEVRIRAAHPFARRARSERFIFSF